MVCEGLKEQGEFHHFLNWGGKPIFFVCFCLNKNCQYILTCGFSFSSYEIHVLKETLFHS